MKKALIVHELNWHRKAGFVNGNGKLSGETVSPSSSSGKQNILPCHMVSLLRDARSYFESVILLEEGEEWLHVRQNPSSLSLYPAQARAVFPTCSASPWTWCLTWASGGRKPRLWDSAPIWAWHWSGSALCPSTDIWGVCLHPQAPGLGFWILPCFSSLSQNSGNL